MIRDDAVLTILQALTARKNPKADDDFKMAAKLANWGLHDEAVRGLRECERFIRSNKRPLVRGAVGLHASFTVSDSTIREAGDLCRSLGATWNRAFRRQPPWISAGCYG